MVRVTTVITNSVPMIIAIVISLCVCTVICYSSGDTLRTADDTATTLIADAASSHIPDRV